MNDRKKWTKNYLTYGYNNVLSLTKDASVREALTNKIDAGVNEILIPGCGSETYLQRHIFKKFRQVTSVSCTDWSRLALDLAKTNYQNRRLHYVQANTCKLPFNNEHFDYIINSNSILSGDDFTNRQMINECYRILRYGGKFCGFFPCIFSSYEVAMLDEEFSHVLRDGTVNVRNNIFYNKSTQVKHLFYTPLKLKQIFSDTGFIRKSFEIYFFDNAYFLEESQRLYGIPKSSGISVWEIFVVMEKI